MILDIPILILVFGGFGFFFYWMIIEPILEGVRLEKKLKKENKYGMKVKCANCSDYNVYFIPIGISVNDHLEGKICKFCKSSMRKFIGDKYIE